MRLLLCTLVALAAAAGWARAAPPQVQVEGDEFSKVVTINGLKGTENPFFGSPSKAFQAPMRITWFLRSFVDLEKHVVGRELYVDFLYSDNSMGKFTASDDHANPLKVLDIHSRDCISDQCPKESDIGIALDDAMMTARANDGFRVKVVSKSGVSEVFVVDREMIEAQLYAERAILSGAVVVGQTVKSGGYISAAADPEILRGALQARMALERFTHVRYRVIVAAAEFCGEHTAPVSGMSFATLSNIPAPSRRAMLAAYPQLSDALTVLDVVPGSGAERAGLKVGDLIRTIDGAVVPQGEGAAAAAVQMMRAAQYAPFRIGVWRDGAEHESTVTPARACSYRLERANDALIDMTGAGDLHGGLQDFARSDDELGAAMAFGLATEARPGDDAVDDKLALAILARAGYALDAAPQLWRRLAEAKSPLTVSHPAPPERLAAMQDAISETRAKFSRTGSAP